MDYAIKVLFIAFALLITILTCSFALYLFREQRDIIDIGSTLIDQTVVKYHNISFVQYDSEHLYYYDVKTVIDLIINNNIQNKNSIYEIELLVYDSKSDIEVSEGKITNKSFMKNYDFLNPNVLSESLLYKIELIYNKYGLIGTIRISNE